MVERKQTRSVIIVEKGVLWSSSWSIKRIVFTAAHPHNPFQYPPWGLYKIFVMQEGHVVLPLASINDMVYIQSIKGAGIFFGRVVTNLQKVGIDKM